MNQQEDAKLIDCRAAFERWFAPAGGRSIDRNGHNYTLMQTNLEWGAWRAGWMAQIPEQPSDQIPDAGKKVGLSASALDAMSKALDNAIIWETTVTEVIDSLRSQGYHLTPIKREIIDDREPAGLHEPKPGTYLYGIDQLLAKAAGKDAEFLSALYGHVNALYVEKRIYEQNPALPIQAQEKAE